MCFASRGALKNTFIEIQRFIKFESAEARQYDNGGKGRHPTLTLSI